MKNIKPRYILSTLVILALCFPVIFYTARSSRQANSGSKQKSVQNDTTADDDSSSDNTQTPGIDDTTNGLDSENEFVIVIDPGHGGYDPGKVGEDGTLEKDINLAISLKLAELLKSAGYTVYMTRDSDISLNTDTSGSKKSSDMRARIQLAEDTHADLFISIHQNSYSAESVHGGQVFYYETSSAGKSLAECIQRHLTEDADPTNTRSAKGNSEYIVLTESPCTSAIVECGFLSNTDECRRLSDDSYQQSMAQAICSAVNEWHAETGARSDESTDSNSVP